MSIIGGNGWRRMATGALFIVSALAFFALVAPSTAAATSSKDLERVLTNRLLELQQQITAYRNEIRGLEQQQTTLQQQIAIANLEIQRVQGQIEATNLAISVNERAIAALTAKIDDYEAELDRQRVVLNHFLKLVNDQDRESTVEIILAEDNFHDFFNRLEALRSVQTRMLQVTAQIHTLKAAVEGQRSDVNDQREENLQLKALQQIQAASLGKKVAAKAQLIKDSKVRASILNDREQETEQAIAEVKKNLYVLQGLSGSLSLEDAYAMALRVSIKVGMRPAFLMAVIKKESDWGNNIGGGTWRRDMNSRDFDPFLVITKQLGLNPDAMPVSAKPAYGWGGAMGPAQFLPRTWLAYEDEIALITGHNPPSPWNLEDAFAAAAIKLSSNGANQKTWDAEWKAAQLYFAGKNWNKPQYSFYGDAVMDLADAIQNQINQVR